MDTAQLKELRTIDTGALALALAESVRTCRGELSISAFAGAYVLLKYSVNNNVDLKSEKDFIETSIGDDEKALFIQEALSNCWNSVSALSNQFHADTLLAYLLFHDAYAFRAQADYTPTGVSRLAISLLDISNNDSVADFGTGRGTFIRDCFEIAPLASYFGNDINTGAKEIAAIRAELLGGTITIKQENILNMDIRETVFDKAFSNYPFGLKIRDIGYERNTTIRDLMRRYSVIKKSTSSDWLFNTILVNSIREAGKAVAIMTSGSTWNMQDKEVRKLFLESGYIEAVISLPEKLFESTSIPTTMILFSHGNKNVMVVDARKMYAKGRRQNAIMDEHICQILEYYKAESTYSKRISIDEFANNDYILNPTRYMENVVAIRNGIPFSNIIKNITRGAQLTAEHLDKLMSSKQTDKQYLMLSNVRDGRIDEQLPYLTNFDANLDKYCLKNNSLILSKNGFPFKIAVASIKTDQKILANGNLYIIELDENKADPYFIKAFLESDKGVAALKSICAGTAIPNIGVDQLKKMLVPSMPLEKQREVANKYLAVQDEIDLLNGRISKATSSLRHIFDLSEED